tara:strand:- start:860 stop:1375 length:516 start_codon:yes stop_codon:yes gene_type:complete
MDPLSNYAIHFVGLKEGLHEFNFEIDDTFFKAFDYNEFNNSKINCLISLEKKSTLMNLKFNYIGLINVNCDISNEPFDFSINLSTDLVVKFGKMFNDENDEIIILSHGSYKIDVSQYIYEMIVLSVPLKKIHPGIEKGTLKTEVLKRLEELSPKKTKQIKDPRWDKLKDLL